MKTDQNKQIGFIGQGWIGKNYADDFENRGFKVIRYALEEPYNRNKDKIKECDVIFIAVPTPTTPEGFDDSILRKVVKIVGKGKTAVIKSTLIPGTTESIQKENPDIFVLHSPEFLTESSAAHDAANPARNIIGLPIHNKEFKEKAKELLDVLPKSPYNKICLSKEAELIKYAHNINGYVQVVLMNVFYDLSEGLGCGFGVIKDAMLADPMMSHQYLNPVHQGGRGAGGHCFIKDFAAFKNLYKEALNDELGDKILSSLENKNIELLLGSDKSLDLLEGVYGSKILKKE